MTSTWIRRIAAAAGVTTVLLAGSAGASPAQDAGDSSPTTAGVATEPGPTETTLEENEESSTTPSVEVTPPKERVIAQPAEFVNSPIVVVKSGGETLPGQITDLTEQLEGAVTVQPAPAEGAVGQLEPEEALGVLEALVALKDQGFVRLATADETNPTITVGVPPTEGGGAVPAQLEVRSLSVEVPEPAPAPSTQPVVTDPTDPSTSPPETTPATPTPSEQPSGGSADTVSVPAPDAGSADSGTGGPATDETGDATTQDPTDETTTSPPVGDDSGSQVTPADAATTTTSAGTPDAQGFRGVRRQESTLGLEAVDGSPDEYSTAELRNRLAQTQQETFPVEVQFDLVADPAAPGDEAPPQFSMTSSLTRAELLGEPEEKKAAPAQTDSPVAEETGRSSLLWIMLGALVLLAGIAALGVWFVARRQKGDPNDVSPGEPPGQQVPGGLPPPTVPRPPSDPTEGAALPVAAGTSTLTALAFRNRVDARSQIFSLTPVPSVNGTNQSVPGGSEALEKWWGGPIADGAMMGGWSEKIPGKGEDAPPVALATPGMGSTLIAVADGLGGAGARTVSTATGEATAARVASGLALDELAAWWVDSNDVGHSDYLDLKRNIAGILRHQLRDQADAGVVGTLVREYPTTLAAATVDRAQGKARVTAIWAGDSRVYLFSRDGFQLLTTDQVSGDTDELAQMYADPQMTNMISADRPFNLQVAATVAEDPFLVLVATDGCFGYLPSPAHLEAVLLQELATSASEDEWTRKLTHHFNGVAGDDTSFAALLVGSTFEQFRRGMQPRAERVHRDHIVPLQTAADGDERRQTIDAAWRGYRNGFVARRGLMSVSSVEGE